VAFRTLLDAQEQKLWVDAMAGLDGIHFIGRCRAQLLLQFATRDEFLSTWDAEAYARAITGPKAVEFYPADHFGLGDASREARVRWLADLLALAPASE
jgi:hypothetical protein